MRGRPVPLDAGSVLPAPTPATHSPRAADVEALCCLLTVERCPRSGQRLREATYLSSAVSPGRDADCPVFPRSCPGRLPAAGRGGAPRAGRNPPVAGLVGARDWVEVEV